MNENDPAYSIMEDGVPVAQFKDLTEIGPYVVGLLLKLRIAQEKFNEILEWCEGPGPCLGNKMTPCRIAEHKIAREALDKIK